MKLFLLLTLSILLLSGCATKVVGLHKDNSFTYKSMMTGAVIAGGVVHTLESWPLKKRISYSGRLRAQLIEEVEGLSVTNASYLVRKLGKQEYSQMLMGYEDEGAISEAYISKMQELVSGKRYVVFARVENDETDTSRNRSEVTDSDNKPTGNFTVAVTTSRRVGVALQIIDLKMAKVVWAGNISKNGYNTHEYTEKSDNGFVALVKAIKGDKEKSMDQKYPAPKAPGLSSILSRVFAGLAENLPEED